MEELKDTVEVITGSEEERDQAVKVRVTVLVLIVTALTALSAFLAARSDARAVATARDEQVATLAAQDQADRYAVLGSALAAATDTANVDFYRAAAYQMLGSPMQSAMWLRDSDLLRGSLGSGASTRPVEAARDQSTKSTEQSIVLGQSATSWREHQSSYISIAGTLAISLFLLGLVLTVHRRRVRLVFFGTAVVIALVSGARLVVTANQPVPSMPATALDAYVRGQDALQAGDSNGAARWFTRVVAQAPARPETWYALGQSLDNSMDQNFPTPGRLRRAVAAYRQAIALGYAATYPEAWNAMAFDELELGRRLAAARDARTAVSLTRHDPILGAWSRGTAAEVQLMTGHPVAARDEMALAVRTLASNGDSASVAQPFFGSLRDDWRLFAHLDMATPAVSAFYTSVADAEAAWDAPAPSTTTTTATATAGTGGASITHLAARYVPVGTASSEGLLTVTFDYAGFVHGDFSLRTYDISGDAVQLLPGSSVLLSDRWTWGDGTGTWRRPWPLQVSGGDLYSVEAYWNGRLLGRTCLQASTDGQRLAPVAACVA